MSETLTTYRISQNLKGNKINLPMKSLLFSILFIFFAISNPGNCTDLQCFVSGECTNGSKITILHSKNEIQCLRSCQQNDNCTWFTFFRDSNFCHLLSSCESTKDTVCPNCISGQRECENPTPICFVQGYVFIVKLYDTCYLF